MTAYLLDWTELLLRWLHLIAGTAWIGASFYFVMLDNSLKPPRNDTDKARGVHGEMWAVHGGGIYCSQKFLAGPRSESLPYDLHWSKWEAYTTWLSGMGLLITLYWFNASVYLIDTSVKHLSPVEAILRSVAVLLVGFLIYDVLSRGLFNRPRLLAVMIALLLLAFDWLLFHWFAARAAYLTLGALMGTWMSANVLMHIIPGQRGMVAQIRAGEPVNAAPGLTGRQRSIHNTYLTLPVLFVMISTHYPMTYTNREGEWVLAILMLAGALIRYFFVLRLHGKARWWVAIMAITLIVLLAAWIAPQPQLISKTLADDNTVRQIVELRCLPCHASTPSQTGFTAAPKGIRFESLAEVRAYAPLVYQTVSGHYMPLGNLTHMSDTERATLLQWCRQQSNSNLP